MRGDEKQSDQKEKQEKTNTNSHTDDGILQTLKFYHGVQSKDEVAAVMKDTSVGYYLIRSCLVKGRVALGLMLSVKVSAGDTEGCVHHYFITIVNEGFVLRQELKDPDGKPNIVESKPFASLQDMVDHFKQHRLACKIRLFKPVRRPWWQLRHTQIHFNQTGKLGAGNFCVVYKGKLTMKREEKDVAVKVSKMSDSLSEGLLETRKLMFAEARIMMAYKHPNVILLNGLACDKPPFMVCMEFCAGGSLEDALKKHGEGMEDFERQILLMDAARGMRYLHTQKCVHRDLASRNCLISSEGLVKIADFGLSKTLEKNQTAFKEALKEAPLAWLAPECIQRESEFSSKTDVWAFGVVIYEVYNNGAKLFAGEDDTTMLRRIKRAKMPTIDSCTELQSMRDVLSSIWVLKPDDRPDFQKILEMLIAALVTITPDDLKKMQINKLKGVNRALMPNVSIEQDLVASVREVKKSESTSEKTRKAVKQKTSSLRRKPRRKKKSKDGGGRDEQPQSSRKSVALVKSTRKGAVSE
uniref:Tyrosine-protein kinase n=1 Tax=Caenorhabditis japonica TaxID=281687 RepID=A0A8R1DTZ0_CAEJA